MTKYIILAQGGVDARWQNPDGTTWLDTPKHLLEIDGETILGRTVRQLRQRGARSIVITGPADDSRYRFTGAKTIEQDQSDWTWPGINAVHGTRELWVPRSRTTLMFGDVFYSDEAMDAIVACDEPDPHWFRRPTASELTGHPWDEPFALSFMPEHHDRFVEAGAAVCREWNKPRKPHLWHHMARMLNIPARRARDLVDAPCQTKIDDWTDDIDKPAQAVAWLGRYYANKINVAVVMPWRDIGDQTRTNAFEFCRAWWEDMGVEVIVASDDTAKHFNVSQARNRGAARSDADVLCFVDADTLVPPDQFWAGVYRANITGQMVIPFTEHRRLDRPLTNRVYQSRQFDDRNGKVWRDHVSGVVMIGRSGWDQVRFDERFVGWGAEDRAFHAACVALLGEHDRLPGSSLHLWHTKSPDRQDRDGDPRRSANLALGSRYKQAAGLLDKAGWLPKIGDGGRVPPDRDAVRALLAEPGGPFGGSE